MLDHSGWYDIDAKEKSFKTLIDIIFISAMGIPGGGKTFITPRMLRHLNLISLTDVDDNTMVRIFKKILSWFLTNNFKNTDLKALDNKIVNATLHIYK